MVLYLVKLVAQVNGRHTWKEDLLLACELSLPNCGEKNLVPIYKFLMLLPMECNTHKLIMLENLMAFSKATKLVIPKYLYEFHRYMAKWK